MSKANIGEYDNYPFWGPRDDVRSNEPLDEKALMEKGKELAKQAHKRAEASEKQRHQMDND